MSNYVVGRGKLFFDPLANGALTGERYLGNSTQINLNLSSEKLDHFNSDEGVRVKDASVLLSISRAGSMILDDISDENLALFFIGALDTQAQASGSVAAEAHNNVKPGRYYQLGAGPSNPTGVRDITTVVVKDDGGSPVTFAAVTDYTVDLALGRLYIVPGGAIVDGTNLKVDYSKTAKSRKRIITGAQANVQGALRYIATNPQGELRDIYCADVTLSPNGDFALKAEQDWQQLPFNIEFNGTVYLDGRAYTP